MRNRANASVTALMINAMWVSAFAAPQAPGPGQPAEPPGSGTNQMDLFKLLERPPGAWLEMQPGREGQVAKVGPTMICGMKVIQGNPNLDPKIVLPVPDDADYKLRVVEPPACGEKEREQAQPAIPAVPVVPPPSR